jgi:hypothetical protein
LATEIGTGLRFAFNEKTSCWRRQLEIGTHATPTAKKIVEENQYPAQHQNSRPNSTHTKNRPGARSLSRLSGRPRTLPCDENLSGKGEAFGARLSGNLIDVFSSRTGNEVGQRARCARRTSSREQRRSSGGRKIRARERNRQRLRGKQTRSARLAEKNLGRPKRRLGAASSRAVKSARETQQGEEQAGAGRRHRKSKRRTGPGDGFCWTEQISRSPVGQTQQRKTDQAEDSRVENGIELTGADRRKPKPE